MVKKIAYNDCYGGFHLSRAATMRYAELKGITLYPEERGDDWSTYWTVPPGEARNVPHSNWKLQFPYDRELRRDDPILIQVIEELGNAAGKCIKIAELPDGAKWRIDEYDGKELVMTPDDYDWSD